MAKTSDEVKFKKKQKFTTRYRNRCALCGRARAYMRRFGICRICFRKKALAEEPPQYVDFEEVQRFLQTERASKAALGYEYID